MKNAEAIVIQRPTAVCLMCPSCKHENEFDYDDFCNMYGDPPDWERERIVCEECGEEFQINGQDWS